MPALRARLERAQSPRPALRGLRHGDAGLTHGRHELLLQLRGYLHLRAYSHTHASSLSTVRHTLQAHPAAHPTWSPCPAAAQPEGRCLRRMCGRPPCGLRPVVAAQRSTWDTLANEASYLHQTAPVGRAAGLHMPAIYADGSTPAHMAHSGQPASNTHRLCTTAGTTDAPA